VTCAVLDALPSVVTSVRTTDARRAVARPDRCDFVSASLTMPGLAAETFSVRRVSANPRVGARELLADPPASTRRPLTRTVQLLGQNTIASGEVNGGAVAANAWAASPNPRSTPMAAGPRSATAWAACLLGPEGLWALAGASGAGGAGSSRAWAA
jgi:hypothetical protein